MKTISFILLVMGCLMSKAQVNYFLKTLSNSGYVQEVLLLNTGGYILNCMDTSGTFLARYDDSDNLLWKKGFDLRDGYSYDIIQVDDGGIVALNSKLVGGVSSMVLLKFDLSGNLEWSKNLASVSGNSFFAIAPSNGNTFIAAGTMSSNNTVIKIDAATGNIIWQYKYGSTIPVGSIFDIKSFSDGNYLILQRVGTNKVGMIKIDNNGNIIWAKTYSVSNEVYPWNVLELQDEGILVSMQSQLLDSITDVATLLKTDSLGNTIFLKTMAVGEQSYARMAAQLSTGEIVLSGNAYIPPYSNEGLVIQLNEAMDSVLYSVRNGNMTYGHLGTDENFDITVSSDNKIFLGSSAGASFYKFSPLGMGFCGVYNVNVVTQDFGVTSVTYTPTTPIITSYTLVDLPVVTYDFTYPEIVECLTVGDQNVNITTEIDFWPNPVVDKFFISKEMLVDDSLVEITDMLGHKIELKITNQSFIDCSNLSTGLYIALIQTKNKRAMIKFVKN